MEKSDLAGLPESLIELAGMEAKEKEKDGWVFTLLFQAIYLSCKIPKEETFVRRCSKHFPHVPSGKQIG